MKKISKTVVTKLWKYFLQRHNIISKKNFKDKPLPNSKCKTARKKFHLAKRMHNRNKYTEKKETLKLLSKHYQSVLDESLKKNRKYLLIKNKLKNLRTSDTREYCIGTFLIIQIKKVLFC